MKKLFVLLVVICMLLPLACIPVSAGENLKIVSSSVADGDNYAPVSSLITIEFDGEIENINAEDIKLDALSVKDDKEIWSAVSLRRVEKDGNLLKIRLAAYKKYNTEYKLDLSAVVSSDGKKLSDKDKIISFKTFYGEEYRIQEEDFETEEVNPLKWRIPREGDVTGIVQREGDNGNFCYRLEDRTLDINIGQNGLNAPGPLHLASGGIYLFEFDYLIENYKETSTFFGITLENPDTKTNYATYYKGVIGYNTSKNAYFVRADDPTLADNPKPSNAFVEAEQGKWSHLMIYINKYERTVRLYVNGVPATNPDGKYEFMLPMTPAENEDDYRASSIRNFSFGVGGDNGDYYIDNISVREISNPIMDKTNVKEGMTLSTSCPQFNFLFRNNEVKEVKAYLNDELLPENVMKWKRDGSLNILPFLTFGENYTLKLSAEDMFGNTEEFEYNFSTIEQPDTLIEMAGFFDGDYNRLEAIKPAYITAKLRFWQKEKKGYLVLMGVYKETDGKIQMLSLSETKEITATENLVESSVMLPTPEDTNNCFVRVFVLKDSLVGLPYERNLILGDLILK